MTDEGLPKRAGDERSLLIDTLDYLRRSLLRNLDGLDEETLRRPGVASGTSLLGLVDHLAGAEAIWIVFVFEGSDEVIPSGEVAVGDRTLAEILADWERYAARTDRAAAGNDLDALSQRPTDEGPVTLRWILVHLIEEIARHAGHADIIREQIDGSVGR
ncbi:MAG: DinB family protein [Acidimicrobiales bacterium]